MARRAPTIVHLLLLAVPCSSVIIELLKEPTYFATRGMCADYDNFTNNMHAADISVWHTLPFDSNWTIGVRIQIDPIGVGHWIEKEAEQQGRGRRLHVHDTRTADADGVSDDGLLHGESSEHIGQRRKLFGGISLPEYGGVFGIGSAISVGLHNEEAHKAIISVPPISGMYHSQGELNPLHWETSEITKNEENPDVIDLVVIRNGMQISVCANGESILDFTDVEFWEPGLMYKDVPEIPEDPPNDHWSRGIKKFTNSWAAVSELPFCEKDGTVSLGYKVPQHWTRTGGQPPGTHTWSASGVYHHVRYSSDAYTTCADAASALDFDSGVNSTTTLPWKARTAPHPRL